MVRILSKNLRERITMSAQHLAMDTPGNNALSASCNELAACGVEAATLHRIRSGQADPSCILVGCIQDDFVRLWAILPSTLTIGLSVVRAGLWKPETIFLERREFR